jgi:cobalt-zinc-cadmium resistance protein CzcA
MFDRAIAFSLKNKLTVLLTFSLITLWCALGVKDLAVDAVPDITNVQVQVNVKTRALDPETIELQVTRNLETGLSGIPGLSDMRSISKFGLSQVTLIFEEGTDIYWARQQIAERLGSIELPRDVEMELAPITTGLGEVYMYTLKAGPETEIGRLPHKERLTELRTLQDYVVRPHLKKVAGVADVDSNGGFVKEVHINFFPKKMEAFGLTTNQLLTSLETIGVSSGGGYIQSRNEQVIVRTSMQFKGIEEISSFPLGITPSGRPIQLKDVAEVRIDHSLRVGAATHGGEEAVLGTVLMRVGANGRSVVKAVEDSLKDLKLPPGVEFIPLYTRSFLVDNTIRTVSISLLEGALLVILVLLVLLGSFKAALVVTLAIPISMLIALKGMNLLGITGNLMSLGAIDFGLLVDGSVVIVEAILAKLAVEKFQSESEREGAIFSSAREVMAPVVAGIILIMAVYLPVLTLEGVEGKMFRPMALTVLMALGSSLLVAIFLMPVLARLIRLEGPGDHETVVFRFFRKLFVPFLDLALRKPAPIFFPTVVVLLLSGALFFRLGSDFIPELDEGDLVLGLTRSARISVDSSVQEQLRAEKIILEFPEVKVAFARLGTPESATDPMGVNLADTFLILEKDRSKWRFESKDELARALMERLTKEFPETEVSATQPIGMRFNEMLEGSRADLSLRIIGPGLSTLYDYGQKAQGLLIGVRGVESIEQDPLTALRRGPVLDIRPEVKNLAAYGVSLKDLNTTVEFSLAGKEVGSFIENNIRFPIVVHMDESLRDDLDQIEALPIELPLGATVPLSRIATVKKEEKITTIARNWGRRYSAISINVSGRDIGGLVDEAKSIIEEELGLEKGYELQWGGQFKNMERANERLLLIVPLTLLVVFLILLRTFGSLPPALLVFSSVPFAGVGGVIALWARGLNFSVSAGVGFIALIGIALLNSLVLITVLLKEFEQKELEKAVREGTLSRLRPVLMTALVAGLGFLPMALNQGLGAEVQRPLATVVIGGLVTSTFLTLVLIPSLFYRWKKGE